MDKKELKLKAEQRLFEAAARYFEEPDCVEKAQLKEKTLVDPDTGKKYTIDDEILYNATLEKGIETDEPIDSTGAIDYKFKSEIAKANAAKVAKRAGIVANADSDVFNALLPKIEAATKFIIKQKIEDGTFKSVGTGHWAIPSNAGKAIQNEIYYKIVNPEWKELGGARNPDATALRRAWEKWTGEYDKPKYTIMQGRVYDLTAEVGKSANESTAFDKMLYKAMNEQLTHMYSKKYNVCLTEANKMFIIDDIIAETLKENVNGYAHTKFYIEMIEQFVNDPDTPQDELELDGGLADRIYNYGEEAMGFGLGGLHIEQMAAALNQLFKAGKIVLDVCTTGNGFCIREN